MKRYVKFINNGDEVVNTNEMQNIISENFTWFSYCEFENADIEIKNETIIWKNGDFYKGNVKYMIWLNGVFHNGTWQNGIWEDGVWEGGTWLSGIWNGGTINGGENPNKK